MYSAEGIISGSGALYGKMMLVRIIENNKIEVFLGLDRTPQG